MDPKYLALMFIGGSAMIAVVVWAISDAVVRYAEVQRSKEARTHEGEIAARLERIESAIEAMSLEVERIGELHRFAAQVGAARSSSGEVPAELRLQPPSVTGRVNTPH